MIPESISILTQSAQVKHSPPLQNFHHKKEKNGNFIYTLHSDHRFLCHHHPLSTVQHLLPRPQTLPQLKTLPPKFTTSKKSLVVGVARAELNPQLVISLSTGLSLFLGRFAFFNFQREHLSAQNGLTHFEAGDVRAKEYVSLLKSNDPIGFNIVDVLCWGSIGHIVAYYILATSSNGYDPIFFG